MAAITRQKGTNIRTVRRKGSPTQRLAPSQRPSTTKRRRRAGPWSAWRTTGSASLRSN